MLGLTTTLQPRNTLSVHIGMKRTKALLDTGAQISLASHAFFQNSEFSNTELLAPDYDVVRGVSGNHLPILGKIQLPIDIENKIFWSSIHIVKGLNQAVILGLDFMEKHNVSLNLGTKTIKIAESNVTSPVETKLHFARTSQRVVIPPKHETLLPVRISRLKRQQVVLLEPWGSLEDNSLVGAKTLSMVQNQTGVMKVCNPTDNEIVIGNNTIVATIEVVEIADIRSFDIPRETQNNSTRSFKTTKKKKIKTPLHFDLSESDLNENQKENLQTFLNDHRDVFATNLSELGKTVGRYGHKIDTLDAPPVRMPFYRQPPHLQKEIDRQVQELLDNDIIEESNSEYHSPVVLVKKKDGKFRFCVDYRKLNKITKPLSFPLPRLECVFDTVAEAQSQIFSTFDLHSGYWQLQMDPDTKHKAAFITQKGVYEWKRLGMGLRNSCVSFQMVMSQVLRGLHWKNMLVYVDDFQFLIYHFRILLSSIDSRTPIRMKELYHLAPIIGYLGLDDELVQQIIPIRSISKNNIKDCLPGLHKFLRQGYSEIVKIIFNNLELPLSFCDLGVSMGYREFYTKLRDYRRLANYHLMKQEGYARPPYCWNEFENTSIYMSGNH